MAKRLMAVLGMLALSLTTAVPVLAQEEQQQQYRGGDDVSATGVIIDGLPADAGGFGTHSIQDEASGEIYALRSAGPDLGSYGSQRVTVHGALTPGEEGSGEEGISGNGTLPSIDVTRVEPAGEVEPGPRVVAATGVLGEPYTPGQDPTPVYDLTDEATGTTYTLFDVGAGLDAFVGQRVTVKGTRSPGIDPLSLDVTSVAPATGVGIGVAFELAVEGEPPAGTTFYGLVGQEPVELVDPDGDGSYEGDLALTADYGTFEIPVEIVEGDPALEDPARTIKYFGEVLLEDGDVFSAGVSYDDGTEPPAPTDPEEPTDECLALSPNPEECDAYVAPGGSGNGPGGDGGDAVVSGDTSNANKGGVSSGADVDGNGSMDASDGEKAAEISNSAASKKSGEGLLPATGGSALVLLGISALFAVAGLLVRRATR